MPLQARISQSTFSFPVLELPFQCLDFDFDTAKNFGMSEGRPTGKGEVGKKVEESKQEEKTLTRKDSGETLRTVETFTIKESQDVLSETN